MTEEQIFEIAKNHLEVLIYEDNGCGDRPTDFAATSEQLLKFAERMYNEGKSQGYEDGRTDGYSSGYDAAYYEQTGY